jgi:hypothetical protein
MNTLNINDVIEYVEKNIGKFHQKRLQGLDGLTLKKVLKRKNPYLYKAKNVITAEQIVRGLLDAHVSSNEETVFGDWLEELAIFICGKVYMGKKSGIVGIDLEMDKDNVRYIIAIKSGPNWGNSSQIGKMQEDFKRAARTLRTSNSQIQIRAINGCCYGRDGHPDKGNYFKYCGQKFWEFISANETLYTDIIEPLGWKAKERNDEFNSAYVKIINQFTKIFLDEFACKDGSIDWVKLVQFNSAHTL